MTPFFPGHSGVPETISPTDCGRDARRLAFPVERHEQWVTRKRLLAAGLITSTWTAASHYG